MADSPDEIHLVVLPFTNIGDNPDQQMFSDGLMETLTSSLTMLKPQDVSYWVVASSEVRQKNVMSAADALNKFNATLAVHGSIHQLADHIRLTLNLIDTKTSHQVDSRVLTVPIESLPHLQNEVLLSLAEMINIEIDRSTLASLTAGNTKIPKAYEFYLTGIGHLQYYQNENNISEAISFFDKALLLDPEYSIALAASGLAHWRMYDLTKDAHWAERAIKLSEKAIALDESSPSVYNTLGMIQNGQGKYDLAVQSFRNALELDPYNADAFSGLANAYEHLGNIQMAEEIFKEAVSLQPEYWASYNELGGFYVRQGMFRKAIIPYTKVIELLPNNRNGYSNLGAVYYYLSDYKNAIEMFKKSVEIEPGYVAYSNLGTLYFYESDFENAVRMFEEALNISDHDYRVWGHLAAAYRWAGEDSLKTAGLFRKAVELAEQERDINPRDANLFTRLAGYKAALGEAAYARNLLSKALQIAPENIHIIGDAGRTYEQLGNREKALELISQAIQKGYPVSELEKDPHLENLRNDPAYKKITREFSGLYPDDE